MSSLAIGLVGTGHISTAHVKGWRRAGSPVRGVFDVNFDAARAFARKWEISEVYSSLEALLAAVEVVDVCTPPQTHGAIAFEATAAGRHLLIEKPVVTDVGEWERLRAAVESAGTQLAVVHNMKFTLAMMRAQRWIAQGRIGEVLRFHRQFLTHPDSDRMLTGGGHWSHALPGGRWFETLPHELYLLHWLVGPLELESVTVAGRADEGRCPREVVATLAGGSALATIEYSASCRLNRRQLELVGSEGAIRVDVLGDGVSLTRARDRPWRRAAGGRYLEAARELTTWPLDRARYTAARLAGKTPHGRLIAAFARCLRGEAPSPTPLDEIDYAVRQSHAIGLEIDRGFQDLGRDGG